MPRRLRWPQLLPGLAIILAVVIGFIAVLAFARVGALHGKKVTLYASFAAARDVMKGTEVWLEGQRAGLVSHVGFQPMNLDSSARVVVEFELLESDLPLVRRNSRAQVRPGGTLIGTRVVYLTAGTPSAAGLAPGDTLRGGPAGDAEEITSQASAAAKEVPFFMHDMRELAAHMKSSHGAVGAFLKSGMPDVRGTLASASRVTGRFTSAKGTIAQAMSDSTLRARVAGVGASLDSVRLLLADSTRTTLGRFRRDSTLARTVVQLRSDLDRLRAAAGSTEGTLGRAAADSALSHEMALMQSQMTALVAEIKRRPLRYIGF